jgi:hypothetical protein
MFSQSFEKSILVDIPGDNYDYDLLTADPHYGAEAFITWVNKYDSNYTIYLKRISPEIGESNIVISSDEGVKSNPEVALNRFVQGIKIVWQNYTNNYYQIVGINYLNDSLSSQFVIRDSLTNDPQITLSTHRLAWIENGNLLMKEFYPNLSESILIDSLNCMTPNLIMNDNLIGTQILYVKSNQDSLNVKIARYDNWHQQYEYKFLSNGVLNTNPQFGIIDAITFQTYENNIWKCVTAGYYDGTLDTTQNQDCNYRNPFLFRYGVPTSSTENKTPFFLAFDTDSLTNNNEIFIKPFYFGLNYNLINISNSEGNDYNPRVGYIANNDSIYVAIFWLHEYNSKTDIWMAKTVFDPIYTSVKSESINTTTFELQQNYPNPFNPTTKIRFTIPLFTHPTIPSREGTERSDRGVLVTLKVYDILGNEITTLVNESRAPGTYEVEFNSLSGELSSGIYIYRLSTAGFSDSKKLVLMK